MSRSPWLTVLIALAGCDVAFRLEAPPVDAPTCLPLDEDCDGQLDAEDSCPADADVPGEDDDSDGLGNACDPNRTSLMDSLVLFDGFNQLDTRWLMVSGDWRIADGAMVQSLLIDAEINRVLAPPRTRPSAQVHVDAIDQTVPSRVGVYAAEGLNRLTCAIVTANGAQSLHLLGFLIDQSKPLPGTGPVRLVVGQAANGQLYCRARRLDGLDVEHLAGFIDMAAVTIDNIGLVTSGTPARYTSLTLYTAP